MRADGASRKQKMETSRVVGIGMMLAGILAFTFAVAGMTDAGATNAAQPAHHTCESSTGWNNTTGQVAGAINQGCNGTTTTWNEQCGCSTTTTTMHKCTCSTTSSSTTSTSVAGSTTLYTTSTTESTTTSSSTSTSTSTSTSSSTTSSSTTTSSMPSGNTVNTAGRTVVTVGGVTSTLPSIAVSPASGQLPFTGGSPYPLAGLGLVMLGAGAGLARRKRRLA